MKYIALLCVLAAALTFVGVVPGRAQSQAGSGMQDSGPYIFGKEIYEFTVAPNGNGMIYKFSGNSKAVAAVIMGGKISGFGGKDPGDAGKAYAEWYAKTHPGASAPVTETAPVSSAPVVETAPSTQPRDVAATGGGDTPPKVVWAGAGKTVTATANGVQFSSDGKHLRIVSGPYANIGAEYEAGAGKRVLSMIRASTINNPNAAGGVPTPGAFWEFYIGREDQAVKQFYWSTNSMDVAGKSGTPTPLLQQVADAAAQIAAVPPKEIPTGFHPIEGMDKIKKFLPPRP